VGVGVEIFYPKSLFTRASKKLCPIMSGTDELFCSGKKKKLFEKRNINSVAQIRFFSRYITVRGGHEGAELKRGCEQVTYFE
jgi:hypothetical protein